MKQNAKCSLTRNFMKELLDFYISFQQKYGQDSGINFRMLKFKIEKYTAVSNLRHTGSLLDKEVPNENVEGILGLKFPPEISHLSCN